MLQTALEAAHRAGKIIAERYPAGRTVTFKGYRDLVTDTDLAAETAILDLIRSRFPDHAILSEEAGGDQIGRGYTWVVDPVDGTTNYAHRVPIFAVSVGLLKDGAPLLGVIHDPMRDQTFVAEKDKGARLDGKPLHTSQVDSLDQAVICLDWGHEDQVRAQVLGHLQDLGPRCGTMRALGCATLALAYVAAGWLDGYLNLALKPWDTAAGVLLIAEAGGRCSTMTGEPYTIDTPGGLATNGRLHESLLKILNK